MKSKNLGSLPERGSAEAMVLGLEWPDVTGWGGGVVKLPISGSCHRPFASRVSWGGLPGTPRGETQVGGLYMTQTFISRYTNLPSHPWNLTNTKRFAQ